MKKLLGFIAIVLMLGVLPTTTQAQVQGNYAGYLGALDTLTNADANTYTTSAVIGNKHCITFQTKVLKISGTVAGTIKLYGSADGVDYGSAALDSLTLADASKVYQISRTYNGYSKYKWVVATTGTSSASERSYMLIREQ